jgi:hypothetical protein
VVWLMARGNGNNCASTILEFDWAGRERGLSGLRMGSDSEGGSDNKLSYRIGSKIE